MPVTEGVEWRHWPLIYKFNLITCLFPPIVPSSVSSNSTNALLLWNNAFVFVNKKARNWIPSVSTHILTAFFL
jgi:hypothetical protein